MSTRAGLGIVVVLVVAIIGTAMLSGCATKPPVPYCERWDAKVFVRDGELLGMQFDGPNAEKMVDMMLGLAKGTCRLQPREGPEL